MSSHWAIRCSRPGTEARRELAEPELGGDCNCCLQWPVGISSPRNALARTDPMLAGIDRTTES
jgi:hypothetical protein